MRYLALGTGTLFLDGDWIESKDLAETGIRYITTGNVGEGVYKEQGSGFITEAKFEELQCTEVLPGDMLVSRLNRPIGRACVVPELGCRIVTSVDNVILRASPQYDRSYLVYLFSSQDYFRHTDNLARGATMQRISRGQLGSVRVVAPPLEEQTQIARFLDYETARIDALIEKQQQLIELLKEKRQAVISHAVTKGLDPKAPMRDSGIEWLGQVPAHWTVKKLRYFATILRGKFTHRPRNDPAFYDGRFPFVQTGDITGASKYITTYKQTLNDRGASVSKEFPRGTLVMAIAANIGDVAILDFSAYFPDSVVGLLPNATSDVMFLYYMMHAMKQPMLQRATISTQLNLNVDQIGWLTSACPPIDEQRRIAAYLDDLLSRISQLEIRIADQLELLQERRTALISAAVTGKIDVRNWKAPKAQQEVA
ncbi:MAG: restriction endonuclease subunit S [Polyangiaceae bacterium]|nr:restriction endonuclease subunit S [Polyangiaceae bacterium]